MEYLALEEVDKSICPVCGKETPDLFSHLKEEWEKKWEEKVGKIQVQIDELRKKLKDTDSLLIPLNSAGCSDPKRPLVPIETGHLSVGAKRRWY
jgi:DNA repair exonuclease SbcCD ATPase subunit